MLVPSLTFSTSSQKDALSSLLSAYNIVSDAIIQPDSQDALSALLNANLNLTNSLVVLPNFSSDSTSSEIIDVLDAGAAKVVIPLSVPQLVNPSQFEGVPADRLVFAYLAKPIASESDTVAFIDSAKAYASTVWFRATNASWLSTASNLSKPLGDTGAVLVQFDTSPAVELIAELDARNISVVLDSVNIALSGSTDTSLVFFADAFTACLETDRPDGLYATVVVDKVGVALGLVYSSRQSIAESIRTQAGVYQSRTRGLWYKGATSGATQKLVQIRADCDRDSLRFVVEQKSPGFCHLNTRTCFGSDAGISALAELLAARKSSAPAGSYTKRLFDDPSLLRAKIIEEAEELCDAKTQEEVAWEAADLIYFALVRCVVSGVTLADVEKQLERRNKKVTRRAGDAKPKYVNGGAFSAPQKSVVVPKPSDVVKPITKVQDFSLTTYRLSEVSPEQRKKLLQRPIMNTSEIMNRVSPILQKVRAEGDAAVLEFTSKFDQVTLPTPTLRAPFDPSLMRLEPGVQKAIDLAYHNIHAFHAAQLDSDEVLRVETMPGVVCERFVRPIEKVGIYVPGGTAVLPSTTLMLGVPAKVAGCKEIVVATPPRKDGSVCPEVLYVADKIGASTVVLAGGAQAVAAMAYGTQTVPKVDKICGPGNQYVTAAKMMIQNDTSALVSIDMPAGPSEVLVIADPSANPAYVAADLLSQAEHGVDSQVVLIAVGLSQSQLSAIEQQVKVQGEALPRAEIARAAISSSFTVVVDTVAEAMAFSNEWAPEHLILHLGDAEGVVKDVQNAGSVFVGPWSPESCGDYASGTNHTLPTYGFARMYSGVNTHTFVKHVTSQRLTRAGLDGLGDTVATLAAVEGLDAHRNAVLVRLKDIRA
ncbi:histidinol dehydrogenase-domain-containing protein [Cladochytrium replicatum]|nr:histidinol dehydrogenase-domain-containing protein [Cladochytrium replicatum]